MNPFTHPNYWNVAVHLFNQDDILPKENPGTCFILGLEWLNDFFKGVKQESPQFWNNLKKEGYVTNLIEKQSKLELPATWVEHQFQTKLRAIAKSHHLLPVPLIDQKHDMNISKEIESGNKAAIIFLKKDYSANTGHVFFVASRKKKTGELEIGIFDATQGELLFSYDYSVNLKQKQRSEIDPANDTRHVQPLRTYQDAYNDLLEFYLGSKKPGMASEKETPYTVSRVFYFSHAKQLTPPSSPAIMKRNFKQMVTDVADKENMPLRK